MASTGFPQRKAYGSGGMTSPGAGQEALDGPPPSPLMAQAGSGQLQPGMQPQMPSFAQMSQPLTAGSPGRAVSPEIAMGIMQTAETIYGILDSMASIAPDLANDFALQKDLLQRTMGKLLVNGGASGAPGATGLNFPGGGFASGAM
jgi:hypothetical protein